MIRFTPRPLPLLLSLLTVSSASVFAKDEVNLDAVVVTASGYEQQIKEAPASISVISREQLKAKPYTNLEDAVRQIEGVSVTGSSPQYKDISIRGLPGEYTLILVDGKRQGTRETMNRGTGGVQASMLPPAAAIERIEVIRGPMSSLYGSDAMGGVINIITRKVAKQWQGTVSVGGTLQGDSASGNTGQGEFWLSGPLKEGVLGLQVFANYSDRAADEIYFPTSGVSGLSATLNRNVGGKLTLVPNEQQEVILEAGHNDLTYLAPKEYIPSWAGNKGDLETKHSRDHLSITHNGRWGFGQSKLALYREVGIQEIWKNAKKDVSEPKIVNTVLDGLLTLPFDTHVLKTGLQFNHANLTGIANESAVPGFAPNTDDVTSKSWAVFVEDEYALNTDLSLTGGLRVDNADGFGAHWSPRLYGVYKLTDTWTLRGGVSSAFRAPAIRQKTADYCMQTRGGAASLCGNPNLKPEESISGEVGVRYDGTHAESFSLTVFNNKFKNKIVNANSGLFDSGKRELYVYDNVDKVTMRGVEVAASWPLSTQLAVSANYTYTDSKREGGLERGANGASLDGEPLGKTPKHLANAQLDWKPLESLSSYAHATYIGEQVWHDLRSYQERPGSLTFDVGGRYEINKTLSVNFAVMNLSDKIVAVDDRKSKDITGNWMVDEGRRYWLKLEANF
ncbi:MAG: TonB-dependent receptor [Proteobacteria bacterium]|nr:TonB-dependent receptor [Pseudomonadota bacterium]